MKTGIYSIICVICLLLGSVFALASCNSDNPVGIVSAEINENGELVLVYSDGNEQNLGIVVGKDGVDGADGSLISPQAEAASLPQARKDFAARFESYVTSKRQFSRAVGVPARAVRLRRITHPQARE